MKRASRIVSVWRELVCAQENRLKAVMDGLRGVQEVPPRMKVASTLLGSAISLGRRIDTRASPTRNRERERDDEW